jgi:hypothetical protein
MKMMDNQGNAWRQGAKYFRLPEMQYSDIVTKSFQGLNQLIYRFLG